MSEAPISSFVLIFKRHFSHCTSASSALTTESATMCPLKSSEQSNEDNKQRYSETKRGEIKAHLFPGRIVRNGRGQRQKRNVPRAQTMGAEPLLLL
ncbi:jg3115 [Pararge aegeria aegeria]|uniref:Jg3115 protein n=1 Tax=Pararge aegeria aegeria TaxID=348720 RepID=A0A8S4RDN5_9NEOP|nr:jg3115 [Pararge aegeria aegeria]